MVEPSATDTVTGECESPRNFGLVTCDRSRSIWPKVVSNARTSVASGSSRSRVLISESSPRQEMIETIDSTVIATSNSSRVKPRVRYGPPGCALRRELA